MLSRHRLPTLFGCKGVRTSRSRRQSAIIAPLKYRKQQRPTLKLAIWNVRTRTTGLTRNDSDHTITDTRKTAVINNELSRLSIDIAVQQETRLSDAGSIREQDYTFFWQGKPALATREYGVGFAISNRLMGMVELQGNGTTLSTSSLSTCTLQVVVSPSSVSTAQR